MDKSKWTNQQDKYKGYDIGDHTYGSPIFHRWGSSTIKIGKYCSIANGATFLVGNSEHHTDWITTYPFPERNHKAPISRGNTVVGNDVWIGLNALILSGIER